MSSFIDIHSSAALMTVPQGKITFTQGETTTTTVSTTQSSNPRINTPTTLCFKCSTNKKNKKSSCCGVGGSWFGKCGEGKEHTWYEGTLACIRKFMILKCHLCQCLYPLICFLKCHLCQSACIHSSAFIYSGDYDYHQDYYNAGPFYEQVYLMRLAQEKPQATQLLRYWWELVRPVWTRKRPKISVHVVGGPPSLRR